MISSAPLTGPSRVVLHRVTFRFVMYGCFLVESFDLRLCFAKYLRLQTHQPGKSSISSGQDGHGPAADAMPLLISHARFPRHLRPALLRLHTAAHYKEHVASGCALVFVSRPAQRGLAANENQYPAGKSCAKKPNPFPTTFAPTATCPAGK